MDTKVAEELPGWISRGDGIVRGAWRIYEAETVCLALRGPDGIERMVGRALGSIEAAARFVAQLEEAGRAAERERCAKVARLAAMQRGKCDIVAIDHIAACILAGPHAHDEGEPMGPFGHDTIANASHAEAHRMVEENPAEQETGGAPSIEIDADTAALLRHATGGVPFSLDEYVRWWGDCYVVRRSFDILPNGNLAERERTAIEEALNRDLEAARRPEREAARRPERVEVHAELAHDGMNTRLGYSLRK